MRPKSHTNPSTGGRGPVLADLVEALRQTYRVCDTTGDNLPELLSEAVERLGEEVGGVEELVRHRPSSWEPNTSDGSPQMSTSTRSSKAWRP